MHLPKRALMVLAFQKIAKTTIKKTKNVIVLKSIFVVVRAQNYKFAYNLYGFRCRKRS